MMYLCDDFIYLTKFNHVVPVDQLKPLVSTFQKQKKSELGRRGSVPLGLVESVSWAKRDVSAVPYSVDWYGKAIMNGGRLRKGSWHVSKHNSWIRLETRSKNEN
jgi:hypothetical protein